MYMWSEKRYGEVAPYGLSIDSVSTESFQEELHIPDIHGLTCTNGTPLLTYTGMLTQLGSCIHHVQKGHSHSTVLAKFPTMEKHLGVLPTHKLKSKPKSGSVCTAALCEDKWEYPPDMSQYTHVYSAFENTYNTAL